MPVTVRQIPYPITILTDRDKGLVPAIKKVFPLTSHLLCRWHHDQNVKANCRKHLPLENDADWVVFKSSWTHCLNATTFDDYDSRWQEMKSKNCHTYPEPINYLQRNW